MTSMLLPHAEQTAGTADSAVLAVRRLFTFGALVGEGASTLWLLAFGVSGRIDARR